MSKEAMKLKTAAEKVVELCGERPLSLGKWFIDMSEACESLREALAEQPSQQEPVAWGVDWGKAGDIPCVSIIKRLPSGGIEVVAVEYAPYSYTSPPAQRTWVGLTDEEWQDFSDRYGLIIWGPFKREIEAKLKEKNT